jgi:hypothetical protein
MIEGAVCVLIGAVVFAVMMLLGPPPGWRCNDGKAHEWGMWEEVAPGKARVRKCLKCGWVERV